MKSSLLFLLLAILSSCFSTESIISENLIELKNVTPIEVFIEKKLHIKNNSSNKNFLPIIVAGGEGTLNIEVIDGPGKITSHKNHHFIFKNSQSGHSTIRISDSIGQVVKKVITTETPYRLVLNKKYISRNPGKINQVEISIIGGKGKSIISLAENSMGSIINNNLYIPPSSSSENKEKIQIVAEDEEGNMAFDSIILFPPFRVETDKMELTENSPFSPNNKVRIKVFGGVNILENNSGIKVNFKKGQILPFKKVSRNEVVFYPPRKRTSKISNIIISDDIGNKRHLKILINDHLKGNLSLKDPKSELISVNLDISGGSGKVLVQKEALAGYTMPLIKKNKSKQYTINNQVDGQGRLSFIDSNGATLNYEISVSNSLVYLRKIHKYFKNKSFVFYLFKKNGDVDFSSPDLKVRKIGNNRFSASSKTEGTANLKISNNSDDSEINDQFNILSHSKFKSIEPIDFLDSYLPDIFENEDDMNLGYTKFKLTDFSRGIRFQLNFPQNYFEDTSLSCDTNQMELKKVNQYYSIRSPSSINFNHHTYSQVITLLSETDEYSLEESSSYLIKKSPVNIKAKFFPLSSNIENKINTFTIENKRYIITRRKKKLCIFETLNLEKPIKCLPSKLRYLTNSESLIYFLEFTEGKVNIFSLEKNRLSGKQTLMASDFLPSANYILSESKRNDSKLVFQLTTHSKESLKNWGLLNYTIIFDLNSKVLRIVSSSNLSFNSKFLLKKSNLFFLSKNIENNHMCLIKQNINNNLEEVLHCDKNLESYFPINESKILLLKKRTSYWFNTSSSLISHIKYKIELEILDKKTLTPFTTISPEKIFYNARCGKDLDSDSFQFESLNDQIYLIFNQNGSFISQNYSPINNGDQHTIGILRFSLNKKENMIYRQLSGFTKDKPNSHFGFRGSKMINLVKKNNKIKLTTIHNMNKIIEYELEEPNDENI